MGASASRIERVTVYREGARIERVLAADAGATEVRFTGLPLTLEDGSLRARVEGDPGTVAVDVRVGLEVPGEDASLAPAEDAAFEGARLEGELRRAEVNHLQTALGRLDALKVLGRPPPRENESPLPIPLESRQTLLALRTAEEERLVAALAAARASSREADKKLADATDARKRASTARNVKEHELRKVATVKLATAGHAGAAARVVLEYAIPHARWSASYVLTLAPPVTPGGPSPGPPGALGAKAKLGMRALVAQRSGEDWSGVKLSLSTAAADAWVELPELAKARIGRAQPRPRKTGYREPPEGAVALYADYDRVAGPPLAKEPATSPAEVAASLDDRTVSEPVVPRKVLPVPMSAPVPAAPLGGGAPGFGMAGAAMPASEALRAAAAPRSARASHAMAAMPPRGVPPSPQRARQPMTDLMDALAKSEGGDDAPTLDWGLAESPPYSRLRMRAPSDSARGELIAVPAASVYVEALVHVRVDVIAAIHVALQDARVNEGALPPGHELARTNDAYDYLYVAELPCDVASDGAFHAVPVADWDAETTLRHVAVPREAPLVYRLLDISSPIDAALLSGPLDVYETTAAEAEAMYRTTTRMPPTPPRGRVEIGLGVEPAIKIARTTTFQEETAGFLGGSLALDHRISVELRNLLPRPVVVEVRERVPVARKDDADVTIEIGAVEPPWEKWDQEQSLRGGYQWKVPLDPGATRTLSARYTIKISSKLELRDGNRRES